MIQISRSKNNNNTSYCDHINPVGSQLSTYNINEIKIYRTNFVWSLNIVDTICFVRDGYTINIQVTGE